ncbi:hypothetical protein CYLTODRAFT_449721 [Cylindrobasidium torrendii FP15055 ss-10]|uniref:Fungal STAND N-terminal Goodbye domain-containing protein n=1 Tax=Cylindrobasidium torrendii FP15055 ss-10 TaxID=1314674 RepID=A0A0D7BQW7_9AGAR|nr:hypothetical protein CYLTODRAFT_449721 [Cylindrobasidium torrendii FP15055 ss-10]
MSPQASARASLEAAVRDYHKQTGCDVFSSDYASQSGLADDSSPDKIKSVFLSMLRDVQDSKLDTSLGRVLDVLLLFNDISSEIAAATRVPGGKGLFVAFGIFLKTIKNYKDRKGELAALLTEVSDFLERFSIRERLDVHTLWNHELYTRIFVNVLNVFALVTKVPNSKSKRVFQDLGAAILNNKDIRQASALLHRDINAECRWTTVELFAEVTQIKTTVESQDSKLDDIHTDVQECLAFVQTSRSCSVSSFIRNTPPSTDIIHHRPPPDIYTLANDAMVVFGNFTSTVQVKREIRVPLACSVVLAMTMSPYLPFLFRMMLANMISFFMWNQVMMPTRVSFIVTIILWPTRVQVPNSHVRDMEVTLVVYLSSQIENRPSQTFFRTANQKFSTKYKNLASNPGYSPLILGSQEHLPSDDAWELGAGMEIELAYRSAFQKVKSERNYAACPYCGRPHAAFRTQIWAYTEVTWYGPFALNDLV